MGQYYLLQLAGLNHQLLLPMDNSEAMWFISCKGKGLQQQAEVAQGVPDRLRPRIFLTFGTTRVAGRQPLPQEKSLVLIFRG